jgi:hypothetical protein
MPGLVQLPHPALIHRLNEEREESDRDEEELFQILNLFLSR